MTTSTPCVLYLRLSDMRHEEALDGRAERLRQEAERRGWQVYRVIVENDMASNGDGKLRPASAFKRKRIKTPSGRIELRTVRPGFRALLGEMMNGHAKAVLAEDLDRLLRQPRDGEDLFDAAQISGASVGSLSRSIELTEGGSEAERMTARVMAATAAKSSADTARRVAAARARLAGQSYGGGPRPYGYTVDEASEKYHRTLRIVPAEAAVIEQAAEDILVRGLSLRAIARDLNDRGIPTVTTRTRGTRWSPEILRDVLLKPAVTGLTVPAGLSAQARAEHRAVQPGECIPAPWPAILPRDTWLRLHDLFTDVTRRTNGNGSEPRWLLSGFAECHTCGGKVRVGGGASRPKSYVCAHMKRQAEPIDAFITELILDVLTGPDADGILRPAPRKGTDVRKLRAEARAIDRRRDELSRQLADDELTPSEWRVIRTRLQERRAAIDAELADSDQPDPLVDFRGKPADQVWDSLTVAKRRAVVQAMFSRVVLGLPGKRYRDGKDVDPATIGYEYTWSTQQEKGTT